MLRLRMLTLSLVLLALFTATATGQTVFYFPQVGDGQVATIQFQTEFIFVNTGGATSLQLDFFESPTGVPLPLTLGTLGTAASFAINMAAGESLSVQTPGTDALTVGYARVTVAQGGTVGGTAVFTRSELPAGTVLFEAGVPAVTDLNQFTIFVDTIGVRNTGLAMINSDTNAGPLTASNSVTLDLYDTEFNQIATTDVPLAAGEHRARFVNEIFSAVPQAAEMLGSIIVNSPDDLAAVTLRTTDVAPGAGVPTLTTFPVVPGGAALTGESVGVLKRLQNGKYAATVFIGNNAGSPVLRIYSGNRVEQFPYLDFLRSPSGEVTFEFDLPFDPDRAELLFMDHDGALSRPYQIVVE